MAKSGCLHSFGEGKAQRITYPLHKGRYKLEEQERIFYADKETLRMVRDFVSGRSICTFFGPCVALDKHTWLKRLPLNVAHSLGYNLLPGLLALRKEGALCVDRDYPAIEKDCLLLLDRLERVRSNIKSDINIEYRQMKLGGSLLEPLIDDALYLVQRALAVQ